MTSAGDDGRCSFCDSPIDMSLLQEEVQCLHCERTVCGRCGIRQYLSEGDYVLCLECVHKGDGV